MEGKRTKIVCTVGPASSGPAMLSRMMHAGMDVARLNFSHGSHESHAGQMHAVRSAARKSGKIIAILQDLQGPKIRVGELPDDGVSLHVGERIEFTTADKKFIVGGPIPVTYPALHHDVKARHRLLLDDGTLEVVVEKVRGHVIFTKVKVGGTLTSHKGINLPDSVVSAESFTTKDKEDLLFGIAHGVDWVALSFVSCAADIRVARKIAASAARMHGRRAPLFFAKVERRVALTNFAEILAEADGILLGRGDLGVEIPPEEVPVVQKDVVEACRRAGKPVIVATQMLNSMVDNPRSTRAETSDVANAVFDHADAVMLSAESAVGRYPVVAVQAMAAIVREAEQSHYADIHRTTLHATSFAESLAVSVRMLAASQLIAAVAVVAEQGEVSRKINMYRPNVPVFLLCPNDESARRVVPMSGVTPIVIATDAGSLVARLRTKLRHERLLPRGASFAFIEESASQVTLRLVR